MSTMEQALRDEIAWHKERIDLYGVGKTVSATGLVGAHRTRLAALTAALPAPGVEAPGDWVMVPVHHVEALMRRSVYSHADTLEDLRRDKLHMQGLIAAMLAAAPSAPAEISQAQAQAMREALAEVREWISNWSPNFEQDDAWPDTRRRMDAALTPEPPR